MSLSACLRTTRANSTVVAKGSRHNRSRTASAFGSSPYFEVSAQSYSFIRFTTSCAVSTAIGPSHIQRSIALKLNLYRVVNLCDEPEIQHSYPQALPSSRSVCSSRKSAWIISARSRTARQIPGDWSRPRVLLPAAPTVDIAAAWRISAVRPSTSPYFGRALARLG